MTDPYTLLGLRTDATPDDIRAAYRRLAAERHPDANPPERKQWASEQMVQLNAARDLLLDASRREKYDVELRAREAEYWRAVNFAYSPRPRRRRSVPTGRMFVAMTLFIVALPYLWLLFSFGMGSSQLAVAAFLGTVQCFSSGALAGLMTLGLVAFLVSILRNWWR